MKLTEGSKTQSYYANETDSFFILVYQFTQEEPVIMLEQLIPARGEP